MLSCFCSPGKLLPRFSPVLPLAHLFDCVHFPRMSKTGQYRTHSRLAYNTRLPTRIPFAKLGFEELFAQADPTSEQEWICGAYKHDWGSPGFTTKIRHSGCVLPMSRTKFRHCRRGENGILQERNSVKMTLGYYSSTRSVSSGTSGPLVHWRVSVHRKGCLLFVLALGNTGA
jgi:hypothetical protein